MANDNKEVAGFKDNAIPFQKFTIDLNKSWMEPSADLGAPAYLWCSMTPKIAISNAHSEFCPGQES